MTHCDADGDGVTDAESRGYGQCAWTLPNSGTIGMRGTRRPSLGTDDFRVQCSNEPPNTNGLLLIGTKVQNGWEPFGLELRLHLGFFWPLATMLSDFGGAASVELPIPSAPWLVDLHVNLQSIWMANAGAGDTCSGAAFNLAPSRGLRLTIQP